MNNKKFVGHGNITATWLNELFVINVEGPFNKEGIIESHEKIINAVESTSKSRWARIEVFLNNDTIAPVESIEFIENNILHSKSFGCVAISIVSSNIVATEIMVEMCDRHGLAFAVFDNFDDAAKFSKEVIAKSNH